MIQYSLRPIYDPLLPLESFMPIGDAAKFRAAIQDAVQVNWAAANACVAAVSSKGHCRPVPDFSTKTVQFQPEEPGAIIAPEVYDAQLEITREMRTPLGMSGRLPLASVSLLQVGVVAWRRKGALRAQATSQGLVRVLIH